MYNTAMTSYIKSLGVMGIVVALMPFIGVYSIIKDYLLFVIGIAVTVISYLIFSKIAPPKAKNPDVIHDESLPEEIAEESVEQNLN